MSGRQAALLGLALARATASASRLAWHPLIWQMRSAALSSEL